MKCSISAVLPIPGSPATQTIERRPLQAASQASRSRVSASVRPTKNGAAGVAAGGACACPARCGADRPGIGNKAVAAARNRFDEAGISRVVAKRGAQVADRRFQHRVADESMPPDFVEQVVLSQQGPRSPRERAQHREWRRRERDGLAFAEQPHVRLVQFERVEAHPDRVRSGRGLALSRNVPSFTGRDCRA